MIDHRPEDTQLREAKRLLREVASMLDRRLRQSDTEWQELYEGCEAELEKINLWLSKNDKPQVSR